MKQEVFTRIGQTDATVTQASQSEAGSSAGPTGAVASPRDTSAVAAWLAKQATGDMDKAAVSRALSYGVRLAVRIEWRYPSGPNGERMPSYAVAVGCDIGPDGDREAALADLRNFMTSAAIRQIERWLAELSVTVARRADDAAADELRVSVYSSRLTRFPADVVRTVLIETAYTFWPTWEEVEKRCKALTGPRAQMIAALERGPRPEERGYRAPTADEKARIQAMVDEMFPSQSPEDRKDAVDYAMRGVCMHDMPEVAAE